MVWGLIARISRERQYTMFSDDRETIQAYLATRFSESMSDELNASFMVLDSFQYTKLDERLIDIVNDYNKDETEVVQMKVLEAFHQSLNEVLRAHQVFLSEDTPLVAKNQVLAVLYRLQRLEDPVPPLKVLETQLNNEEKFSRLVNMYSHLREVDVMESIENVGDDLLKNLMNFLYTQEESQQELPVVNKELNQTLKDFFDHISKENVAYELIQNGVMTGLSVKIYYPYVKDKLITQDDKETAINLLSLFLMSIDTYKEPLEIYRQYGDNLIESKDRIMKIEVLIGEMLTQLYQYQGAKDVARSVSVVQHQA